MRTSILSKDFLLDTPEARRLYHNFAAGQPIIDYHNHLSAADVANDRIHETITQLWLETDHYKWRAMRANGIDEAYVTGDASDYERFARWADTVPHTIRNPLFHWTHLELDRAFGIDAMLSPSTARDIYNRTNELLATPEFGMRRLIERSGAVVVCTTDDPADSLEYHRRLRNDDTYHVNVFPTFRPDRALGIHDAKSFNEWIERLGERTNRDITTFSDLLQALQSRHDDFHDVGCRLADHGLETFPAADFTDRSASSIFENARTGSAVGVDDAALYRSAVCYHLVRMNHEKGWVQQFHVGPIRNVNTRLRQQVGADAGCDAIGDWNHASSMARFFDRLDREGVLARSILYNVNPRDTAVFTAMAGSFNDGSTPGKMQYGPAWWYLDQMNGMIEHLNVLSDFGLLRRFVGMVTDSRSPLSLFSRHEYFRRVLCRALGRDIHDGILPADIDWIGSLVRAICSENARAFFRFEGED